MSCIPLYLSEPSVLNAFAIIMLDYLLVMSYVYVYLYFCNSFLYKYFIMIVVTNVFWELIPGDIKSFKKPLNLILKLT